MPDIKKLLNNALLKNSIIYTICDAINKSIPFLILPLLSFYLSPADYGVVTNFNIILSITTILVPLGTNILVGVKFYKVQKEELAVYIANIICISIISALLLMVSVLLFGRQIFLSTSISGGMQILLIWLGFWTVLCSIHLSIIRLLEKPKYFGIYGISQTLVNAGVSLLLVIVYQQGWIGRAAGISIAVFVFGILSFIYLIKHDWLKFQYSPKVFLETLNFGLPLVPHALGLWLRISADRLLISNIAGESENGLYATGFQFGLFVSFLMLSFNNAYSPYIYKSLSADDPVALELNKKKLIIITRFVFLFLIVWCAFFTFISYILIDNFFSASYREAKKYIPWAILSQFFQGLYLLIVNYVFFAKKTKHLATITFLTSIAQVGLSYVLINRYGGIGAGYSNAIISLLTFLLVFALSKKVNNMKWI